MSSTVNSFDLNAYDVIAIDMDNTLVKYNLKNTLPLIHELLQKYLIEKYNYPEDIRQEFCPKLSQKGLVIDKQNGNVLKLDANFAVMSAKHGFTDLTKQEIDNIYGKVYAEKLTEILELLVTGTLYIDFDFAVLKDYFTSPAAQVFAKCVDVLDKVNVSSGNEVNYWQLWTDIYNGLCFMYERQQFKARSGGWFPELIENPDKYLVKASESVRQMLKNLRQKGKQVLLVTSSNVDFTRHLMKHCYGNQWIDYFDYVLTYARKPTFFTCDRKFLIVDSDDSIGDAIAVEDLKCGHIYAEGNWADLKTFAAKMLSKSQPKCVYIGDSFIDDCIVPEKYVNCHTIGIVEELEAENRWELDSSYWKSFIDINKNNTLWFQLLRDHTQLIVPYFESLVNYCV
ncbi:5'-nucleotidase domain-containing protein 1-like [Oppia nitens]|uniref:5'-nucleotidase domain-containing protein 1-like n=1 Tax=Oppia nitens TaxID=1686743 RepID=UPI0023DA4A47|nr:5'-nucleotidase domain-containing protein 1-like [Oppia nitens]